eukprot:GCRY01004848.1.p1 GENE.GCRY01004848.1~~GCRY01004848.1.p1  ORF type:complete len:219 (+),score=43.38 GCRY01004848.1:192-848(+)
MMEKPLPTPNTNQLYRGTYFETVYEPAEDTFLLLDTLWEDRFFLKTLNPSVCVELGCGSGCVITYLCQILKHEAVRAHCVGVDINMLAAECTRKTADNEKVSIDAINSNLLSCFTKECVDVLVFNPPYVPSDSEEIEKDYFARAYAGGVDGREVIDKVLPMLGALLSPTGVGYMILMEENKPDEIQQYFQNLGINAKIIASRGNPLERLHVMKIVKGK